MRNSFTFATLWLLIEGSGFAIPEVNFALRGLTNFPRSVKRKLLVDFLEFPAG
jgi:hypothetical protein